MLILLVCCILLLVIIIALLLLRYRINDSMPQLKQDVAGLHQSISRLESGLRDDFRVNREETSTLARENRSELGQSLQGIAQQTAQSLALVNSTMSASIDQLTVRTETANQLSRESLVSAVKDFTLEQRALLRELKQDQQQHATHTLTQLEKLLLKIEERLAQLGEQSKQEQALARESMTAAFNSFREGFDKNIAAFNDLQREKFTLMELRQTELVKGTEQKLESIRTTVEEKLEKTLSDRLGQSFETVGKQLIEVQKGLGEMQTLATDVGGLKKVLSNVKLRGGVGEVQLALLLEQILAPNQYEANVRTKKGSNDPVEFAIKLPGRGEDGNSLVYLPIDAKFPKDAYEHLIAAYENAIPDDIEIASKNMEATIRKMAKDIRDKYLDPPNTTDFAILFLPFESIYAEVIRRSALVDQLRTEFRITVAGPTTLMAILNSLQMGFRTLALQKRSSEVWGVLANVKAEFAKFGGLLEKAQKNIQAGLGQLDEVTGTRTRAINRQLRDIDELPAVEGKDVLPEVLPLSNPGSPDVAE